jgi:predicted ATP-grasp superfamily ATP-dependent carboligase
METNAGYKFKIDKLLKDAKRLREKIKKIK